MKMKRHVVGRSAIIGDETINKKKIFNQYAIRIIISAIFCALMQNADRIVAAVLISSTALVATTLVTPYTLIVFSFSVMFGTGLGSYVGILIGQGEEEKAGSMVSLILLLGAGVGIILTVLTMVFQNQIVYFLGARGEIVPIAKDYLFYLALAWTPMLVNCIVGFLIINDNNPKLTMYIRIATTTLNFVLNILFVLVFNMGVIGLAIATAISSAAYLFVGFFYLIKYSQLVKLRKPAAQIKVLRHICYNGISELIMEGADAIKMYVTNIAIIYFLSAEYMEAYASISILLIFIWAILEGAPDGLQPVFSQLMGAKRTREMLDMFKYGMVQTYKYMIVAYLIGLLLAKPILGYIIEDSRTRDIAFLLYVALGLVEFLSNLIFQSSLFFTAINYAKESTIVSVADTLICMPAFTWIAIAIFKGYGLVIGSFLAHGVVVIGLIIYFKKKDFQGKRLLSDKVKL